MCTSVSKHNYNTYAHTNRFANATTATFVNNDGKIAFYLQKDDIPHKYGCGLMQVISVHVKCRLMSHCQFRTHSQIHTFPNINKSVAPARDKTFSLIVVI